LVEEQRLRTDRSGIELLNRPRPTQGCRVNRRRRKSMNLLRKASMEN